MKKFLLAISLIFFSTIGFAEQEELRAKIEKKYPELKVKSINKTEFNDLYEIYIGGQIIYSDKDFNFLIVEGRLVDPNTKKDLTSERLEILTMVNFNSLPFESAIKDIRGNGKSKIAIFSDIDCPFCRKLEKEALAKLKRCNYIYFSLPISYSP